MTTNFTEISSTDNPLIKLVTSLQTSRKSRINNGLFVLEGLRICTDAADNGIKFERLMVTKDFAEKYAEQTKRFASLSSAKYLLSDKLFSKISDTKTPQGVMAVAGIPQVEKTLCRDKKYVALENLQDPSNLGAVARTAEALGVGGIIMSANGCDAYSPKSLRASMGTLLRMPLYVVDNVMDFIEENGLKSVACVVDADAEKLNTVNFEKGTVLLIGNEANGLSADTVSRSSIKATIPMCGRAESLNAAAAAAIGIWEMMKNG